MKLQPLIWVHKFNNKISVFLHICKILEDLEVY